MSTALAIIEDETKGLDVDRIIIELESLRAAIAAVDAKIDRYAAESEAKIGAFWSQTWPTSQKTVEDHERRLRDLERRVWVATGGAAILGAILSRLLASVSS